MFSNYKIIKFNMLYNINSRIFFIVFLTTVLIYTPTPSFSQSNKYSIDQAKKQKNSKIKKLFTKLKYRLDGTEQSSGEKMERKAIKKKKKKKKDSEKAYRKNVKNYQKNISGKNKDMATGESVWKRSKKTQRKSKRLREGKPIVPWYKRIFKK